LSNTVSREGGGEWHMALLWLYEMLVEQHMAVGCWGNADNDSELIPGKQILRTWNETGQLQVMDVFRLEVITVSHCGTDYLGWWWWWIFSGSWGFHWGATKFSSATDTTVLPAAPHTQIYTSSPPTHTACPQPRDCSVWHEQNGRTRFPGRGWKRFLLQHEFWVEWHSRTDIKCVKWYLWQARPRYVLTFIQTVMPVLCGDPC
jgi:hypothetical protein